MQVPTASQAGRSLIHTLERLVHLTAGSSCSWASPMLGEEMAGGLLCTVCTLGSTQKLGSYWTAPCRGRLRSGQTLKTSSEPI